MKNNEIDNLQYMEWINYFPSFLVSSINNQIINNIANNEINKEDDENLINQEFKLIKNIEIPEKIKEFVCYKDGELKVLDREKLDKMISEISKQ